jgi:molybdopterin-synthase adenylyltransferase
MTVPAGLLPDRPRIKPIYGVLYLDGRIRLGAGPADVFEIDDPGGSYAALVRLLDGTRTISEITGALQGRLDAAEVTDGITVLHENCLIEDAAVRPPAELTERDIQRYAPNLNFFRTITAPGGNWYAPQLALKQTTVTIFGLGGIGSNVCMALAELGVGRIRAVDFDRVELSNLNRQVLYSTGAVGLPKAEVATQRMKEFNPDIDFSAEQRRLASPADVADVIAETAPDFLFCLADRPNGFIDFWTNEACVRSGIPFTAGGIGAASGTAYSVEPGTGPCYQCRIDSEYVEQPQLREELESIRSQQFTAANGALGPACMMLAYFLTYEMLRYRLALHPMLARDRLLEIDFVTFEQQWHDYSRRPDCAICGD